MSNTVIKVENLSKQYRLGKVGTGTLRHDMNRWWYKMRGLEDPYLKIGVTNDRTRKHESPYVWALRDINFDVPSGQALAIVGRNGAGKSTLLKVLSKITTPTIGEIKVKGRVASLLEVGTGFHPELSGRENIFLNGAILGMRRHEIERKLDQIIDFAGVDAYVDTPVKRYSSGMYVRLAFSVAAFLEPEILIVDEVLAVGDIEFQKKCLGRMKDVSANEGRTVLFVSHNMAAVKSLCDKALLVDNGQVAFHGDVGTAVDKYLANDAMEESEKVFPDEAEAPGNELVKVRRMAAVPQLAAPNLPVTVKTPVNVEFEFWNYITDKTVNLSMHVYSTDGLCVFNNITEPAMLSPGLHKAVCKIPGGLLNSNLYFITMMVVADAAYPVFRFNDGVSIEIHEDRLKSAWHGKWPGLLRPDLSFKIENV